MCLQHRIQYDKERVARNAAIIRDGHVNNGNILSKRRIGKRPYFIARAISNDQLNDLRALAALMAH